jgi:hypothetical protein
MIGLGIALILIGLLLGLTGFFGLGGIFTTIGWIILVVGLVLAVIDAVGRGRRRRHVH